MSITVTDQGTAQNASSSTVVVHPLANIAIGDLVVVVANENSSNTGTVTDSGGNTYTLARSANPNNSSANGTTQLFWSVLTTAVSTGGTITYHKGTGSNAAGIALLSANSSTGWQVSPVDLNPTPATGSSTTPSLASGTPALAGELFTAVCGFVSASATFTEDSGHGWATPFSSTSQGSTEIGGGNQVVSTATAKTFAPTLSASSPWAVIIVTFKPAAQSFVPSRGFDPAVLVWQSDPWQHTFVGGRQAYEPRLMSPGIPGQSGDPPPVRHLERAFETGAVAVAARQWQPDPWAASFLGGFQPYDQSRLNPSITAVEVDPPPFGIPLPAQPTWLDQWKADPWPPVFMGGAQAYKPLVMSPGIPGESIDRPPVRHFERGEISVTLKQAWQPEPWPTLLIGGRQPYDQSRLPPAITAVPVNNPPMGHYERWLVQAQINAAQLAQPDPWAGTFVNGTQAYAQFKMNASLMGVPINNPPFTGAERGTGLANVKAAMAWQPDPWPPAFTGGRQPYDQVRLPASVLAIIVNNPPFGIPPPWVSTVLVTWQPDPWPQAFGGGKQAYDSSRLSPGIPGQSVDRPPLGIHPERQVAQVSIKVAWQPDPWPPAFIGGAQPYAPETIPPGAPGVRVDNPPFQGEEFGDLASSIKVQWQATAWPYDFLGGDQPYQPGQLTPTTAGVVVNNPPFQSRGRTPEQTAVTIGQWQPDPWPPVSLGGRQAYAPRQLTPPSIDRPSVLHPERSVTTALIKVQWQPDAWPFALFGGAQPYSLLQIGPGIPGRSVDVPPFQTPGKRPINIAITLGPWQPDPWPFDFLGGQQPYQQGTLSAGVPRILPPSALGPPVGQFVLYFLSSAPGQLFPAYITAFDRATSSATITYFPPTNQPLQITSVFYDPLRQKPSSWSYQDPQDRLNQAAQSVGQVVRFYNGTSTYPGIITALNQDGTVTLTTFAPGADPVVVTEVNYDYSGIDPVSWRYADVESDFVETTGPQLGQIVAFISAAGFGYPAMITGINADGTVSLMGFAPGANVPIGSVAYSSQDTVPNRWQYRARRQ